MNVFILWMPNTIASHLLHLQHELKVCVSQKKNRFSAPQQKKSGEKKKMQKFNARKKIEIHTWFMRMCVSLSRCMCVKWNMEARTDAVDCTRIIPKRVYCIWCDDLVFFFRAAHTHTQSRTLFAHYLRPIRFFLPCHKLRLYCLLYTLMPMSIQLCVMCVCVKRAAKMVRRVEKNAYCDWKNLSFWLASWGARARVKKHFAHCMQPYIHKHQHVHICICNSKQKRPKSALHIAVMCKMLAAAACNWYEWMCICVPITHTRTRTQRLNCVDCLHCCWL